MQQCAESQFALLDGIQPDQLAERLYIRLQPVRVTYYGERQVEGQALALESAQGQRRAEIVCIDQLLQAKLCSDFIVVEMMSLNEVSVSAEIEHQHEHPFQ